MIYFYAVVAFIIGFLFYTRRFFNPFKMIMILGKKGSGKSTYMVKEMLRHQEKGWLIYTDMWDCNIPGVRLINADDLKDCTPPPYSCLFLEEVGRTFDNRKFKTFDDGLRDWAKFLRKYKTKCFMNSQGYDIDVKIRTCVDELYLMKSVRDCICFIRPIVKTVTLTAPSAESESRIAEGLRFATPWNWRFFWMPKYHKHFNSFAAPARKAIPYKEVLATAAS